ncbi:uncharacterized protein [Pagrus major]|uniref:uncharacterized protein n=1 Tax=Pagrus major TaxID=143350 RepID=UPI003CC8CA5A
MEDFSMNTSLDGSFNNSNFSYSDYYTKVFFIMDVLSYIIVSVGLPLTLVAICAQYFLVRADHVAPIYVINLLITDLLQLCGMIVSLAQDKIPTVYHHFFSMYRYCVGVSVGFMVCVAMERYLVIACPLWYRFRRTIKSSVAICVVVWVLPIFFFWFPRGIPFVLLLPFPLFIFFLGGTVKALSASISVPSDEKRRIVGILVLVLLIYTLLFLPLIIWYLVKVDIHHYIVAHLLVQLSPLADVLLYVFMKKGIIDKLLASVCCCIMDNNGISRMDGNDIRRMDGNDIRRMDGNDIRRMDSNDIRRTDSNDISHMDSNDISRMDSNDISRMDSNDISHMDSNDISSTSI